SAKEFCIFAANFIWPAKELGGEELVLVVRLEPGQEFSEDLKQEIDQRNRMLPHFKRVGGYVLWERDFPRTASIKIQRETLPQERSKARSRATLGELQTRLEPHFSG